MDAKQQHTNATFRYPLKAILGILLVAGLAAAVYSAVSSPPRVARVDTTGQVVILPASAKIPSDHAMPAPSNSASEGNVVDLTYPVN